MAWPDNAKREQIPDPDELCVGDQAPIKFLALGYPSKALSLPSFMTVLLALRLPPRTSLP
jgi:hypothetical protein